MDKRRACHQCCIGGSRAGGTDALLLFHGQSLHTNHSLQHARQTCAVCQHPPSCVLVPLGYLTGDGARAHTHTHTHTQANQLLAPSPPYDPATDWRQLATLTAVFTRRLLQAAEAAEAAAARRGRRGGRGIQPGGAVGEEGEGEEPRGRRAVFVMGLPRSGSTLVETVSGHLPASTDYYYY